ncbi:AMP-binding protein [Bacillus amyloliquefaciens]
MLLVGGDKLKRAVKQPYTIINNYGPTENTVVATSGVINPEEGSLSIGRAIANTRVYILGDGDQVQPEGIAGELCVAGRGLARGYLNREEETAKRFTADPFVPGERMYRTGDLVKWNAQCGIEYIGRIDQQVKVRGYRIELSEIEVRLAQLADVHDAAVTAVEDKAGNTALCAYVAPQQDDIEALKFWHHDAFAMTADDKSAKYAGFGFDASIWEMFPTWTIGAELHVIDEAIRLDITRLNHYFEENGVTITFLPTQLAEQFMELLASRRIRHDGG